MRAPLDRALRSRAAVSVRVRSAHTFDGFRYGVSNLRSLSVVLRRHERRPVSMVVTGRNDDYMPDLERRLHTAVRWNGTYAVTEVVWVEWNPPPERPLLAISLADRFPWVKCFVVPARVHEALSVNPHLKMLEYHAKNVGIRRASTDWILSSNADIVLAPATCRAIGALDEGRAYTAERVDVDWRPTTSDRLPLSVLTRRRRTVPYVAVGTGDFLLAPRLTWEKARGYDEGLAGHRMGCDVRGARQLEHQGAELRKIGRVLHFAHPTSATEGVGLHQGHTADAQDGPYRNPDDWGLGGAGARQIAPRVWELST